MRFPSGMAHCLILRLDDFLNLMADLTQLLDEQKLQEKDFGKDEV